MTKLYEKFDQKFTDERTRFLVQAPTEAGGKLELAPKYLPGMVFLTPDDSPFNVLWSSGWWLLPGNWAIHANVSNSTLCLTRR